MTIIVGIPGEKHNIWPKCLGAGRLDFRRLPGPVCDPPPLLRGDECGLIFPNSGWLSSLWRRWTRGNLPTLQERKKWNKTRRNLKVGDLVLLTDESFQEPRWFGAFRQNKDKYHCSNVCQSTAEKRSIFFVSPSSFMELIPLHLFLS